MCARDIIRDIITITMVVIILAILIIIILLFWVEVGVYRVLLELHQASIRV